MEQVPATNHSKVSLREQAEEAQRELAMRQRVYTGLVKRGKMSPAEQAVAINRMRCIRDTLLLFAEHEEAIRDALAGALRKRRQAEEVETLRDHPAVQAVLDVFPEAEIADVRPMATTGASIRTA